MTTDDLDHQIIALRVSGMTERQTARRLGVTARQVREALDREVARTSDPDVVVAELFEGAERLEAIESVAGSKRIARVARAERDRAAKLVLRRARSM